MKEKIKFISEVEFVQFKNGNCRVFKKIFNCYHKILFSYVYSFTKSFQDSEEIVQDTFIALWSNKTKITMLDGLYPYLFVIAKRLMISDFRKKVVRAKYQDHLVTFWTESTSDTESELVAKNLQETIESIIDQLPTNERKVYRLNKLEGLTYQEIAEEFGVSKNTVKNQLIAANKKIKRKLENISIIILYHLIYFIATR